MRRASGWMLALISVLCAGALMAQTVEVERTDGSRLTIDNYAEHQATALLFLSSRSPETRLAVEAIRSANQRYRRRKVMFAGIFANPAESGDEILRFCQASGFVFPCYRDPSRRAARAFGATVTPEAFLLDTRRHGDLQGRRRRAGKSYRRPECETAGERCLHSAVGNADRQARPAAGHRGPLRNDRLLLRVDLREDAGAPVHHASSLTGRQRRPAGELVRRQLRIVRRRVALPGAPEERAAELGEPPVCCCGIRLPRSGNAVSSPIRDGARVDHVGPHGGRSRCWRIPDGSARA